MYFVITVVLWVMVKEVRAPTLEGPGQLYVSLSFKLSRGDLVAWEGVMEYHFWRVFIKNTCFQKLWQLECVCWTLLNQRQRVLCVIIDPTFSVVLHCQTTTERLF